MTDSDRGAPSVDLAGAAVPAPRGAAEAPGAWHDAYPGDTHWYDLPDDDAAPEEGETENEARWRPWRRMRRR
ncbi:hypothetical protein OHB01_31510 [Microbispora hainanensis]|uniref:DUF2510 domain-containing protein n=1 Tax=Microbispora hainanensis TaxID=568844 RepID=A0ABZ1SU53_9ACTN|nr:MULTISPECIES: hypothetical protein [Microbispora]NJP27277.1 hypothetical protein [Microbispora sp. CL1-1]TQS11328.1 hypothetical protein FLW53_24355 [Microbispora sp. SCL1-1]